MTEADLQFYAGVIILAIGFATILIKYYGGEYDATDINTQRDSNGDSGNVSGGAC